MDKNNFNNELKKILKERQRINKDGKKELRLVRNNLKDERDKLQEKLNECLNQLPSEVRKRLKATGGKPSIGGLSGLAIPFV